MAICGWKESSSSTFLKNKISSLSFPHVLSYIDNIKKEPTLNFPYLNNADIFRSSLKVYFLLKDEFDLF